MPRKVRNAVMLAGVAGLLLGADAMFALAMAQPKPPPLNRAIRPAELKHTGPKSPNLGPSSSSNTKPSKPSSSGGSRRR